MTNEELIQLRELLQKAFDTDIAGRTIPTLKGRGTTRYGTYLAHGLQAVETELEARGIDFGLEA
jgi:hypothetical protein